jgi:hypothetical protein
MSAALYAFLWMAVPTAMGLPYQQGAPPAVQAVYWYGNPLKQGTAADVLEYLPRAALATLDAKEQAALEKLKGIGMRVSPTPDGYPFDVVEKDGKRIVLPPPGIHLACPSPNQPKPRPPKPTAKDLAPLAELRHVWELDLMGTFVNDDTLEWLKNMEELRRLYISRTRVTDQGLRKLGCLKRLNYVIIHAKIDSKEAKMTDGAVRELATLPALQTLMLNNVEISDAGVAFLAANPNLEMLAVSPDPISKVKISDAGVAAMAAMPKLGSLGLNRSAVTDGALAVMAKPGAFAKLAVLDLSNTAVSDVGIQNLHDPKALPSLRILTIHDTKVTRPAVMALQKARSSLNISARFADGTRYETRVHADPK